jgi:hypothetical protein
MQLLLSQEKTYENWQTGRSSLQVQSRKTAISLVRKSRRCNNINSDNKLVWRDSIEYWVWRVLNCHQRGPLFESRCRFSLHVEFSVVWFQFGRTFVAGMECLYPAFWSLLFIFVNFPKASHHSFLFRYQKGSAAVTTSSITNLQNLSKTTDICCHWLLLDIFVVAGLALFHVVHVPAFSFVQISDMYTFLLSSLKYGNIWIEIYLYITNCRWWWWCIWYTYIHAIENSGSILKA